MNEKYLAYLDDLNNEERSVFLYCLILKLSIEETAKRLKLPSTKTRKIIKTINFDIDCLPLKMEILEAFGIE
jgi:DNA-directed RNA polymerase specialized sigma24 family protein